MRTTGFIHSRKKGIVAVVMATMLVPLTVAARTVPASGGRPINWNDGPCFRLAWSSMTNECADARSLEWPLYVDNAGPKTVYVSAYGDSPASNVGCHSVGVNRERTAFWGSPAIWLSQFGSPQVITLTGPYVPVSGYLYAACKVYGGAQVHSVEYNP